MNFKRGGIHPTKTLFEDDSGWSITEYEGYFHAAMTHKCKTVNNNNNRANITTYLPGDLPGKHRCSWCSTEAPDHIITIWTLLNWDKQ